MPRFEKATGGEVLLRGIDERVSVGDVVEVDTDFADYLRDRPDFQEHAGDATPSHDPDGDVAVREEDGPPDDNAGAGDGTDERAVNLADESWQAAVATVEAGDADDYLDALEAIDDRDSVQDAIETRRDELEG